MYFITPVISILVVLLVYFLTLRFYKKTVLYISIFVILILQLIPQFLYELSIRYVAENFMFIAAIFLILLVEELILTKIKLIIGTSKKTILINLKDEIKFYIDKIINILLTLGALLGIGMSVMRTTNMDILPMKYQERAYGFICMTISFFCSNSTNIFLYY